MRPHARDCVALCVLDSRSLRCTPFTSALQAKEAQDASLEELAAREAELQHRREEAEETYARKAAEQRRQHTAAEEAFQAQLEKQQHAQPPQPTPFSNLTY